MNPYTQLLRFCVLLLAASSLGCQIGPGRLKVASLHYSDAVRIAQSEQLLVNLVRLRYRDLPTFLSITSISTQFEFETVLDVNGTVVTSGGGDSVGIGGGIRYSERPTLTFGIQGGETFQKRMLQPLEVIAVALLTESGWRSDRVLRLAVEKINGLQNAPTASGPTPGLAPRYDGFLEATSLLRKLSLEKVIDFEYEIRREAHSAALPKSQVEGDHAVEAVKSGMEFKPSAGGLQLVSEKRTLVMRFSPRSDASLDAARLRELLKLKPAQRRFDVVELEDSDFDPFQPEQRLGVLAIDTRSLMGVLYYLSNGVEVPREDLEAGRVTATLDSAGNPFDWSVLLDGLFQVRSSEGRRRPPEAAVAVRHRDRWFYVADDDQTSKSTLTLLSQMLALTAGEIEETKPVLTLPVGG